MKEKQMMTANQKLRTTDEENKRVQRKKRWKFPFSLRQKDEERAESLRKTEKKKRKNKTKKERRPIRRIFPIWLRLIVVILLCAAALILGLMIGYGVIGDGSPTDVLKIDAWKHIIDIVKKEE